MRFVIFLYCCFLLAMPCEHIKALTTAIESNYQLKKELSTLIERYGSIDAIPEKLAAELFKKHHLSMPTTSTQARVAIHLHNHVSKEMAHLPEVLKPKLEEVMTILSKPNAITEMKKLPGLDLKQYYKEGVWAVRINHKYRVVFQLFPDEVHIINVSGAEIHDSTVRLLNRAK